MRRGLVAAVGLAGVLAGVLAARGEIGVTQGRGPAVSVVALPATPGAHAIWGASGQDSRGHIWVGVSAADTPEPSGHLLEHDPETAQTFVRGNVIDELRRLKILRPGEHQAKIHSKIIQGPDGCLYFASMDEEGESESRLRLPNWGGHLWRLRQATGRWEHLRATAEALIAVGGGGRFIYALGYWGHVLYQYDTRTGAQQSVRVGSVDAHISRNLVVDHRGHAFVPRLRAVPLDGGRRRIEVSLVEFGTDLREIAETSLATDRYLSGDDVNGSHGIIALQPMADRSIYFTTHRGSLFRVVPPPAGDGPARLIAVGSLHPGGPRYVASLFTPDATTQLFGMAQAEPGYDWVRCDVVAAACEREPMQLTGADGPLRGLFYGSDTRDRRGAHYVVGLVANGRGGTRPEMLRVEPGRGR